MIGASCGETEPPAEPLCTLCVRSTHSLHRVCGGPCRPHLRPRTMRATCCVMEPDAQLQIPDEKLPSPPPRARHLRSSCRQRAPPRRIPVMGPLLQCRALHLQWRVAGAWPMAQVSPGSAPQADRQASRGGMCTGAPLHAPCPRSPACSTESVHATQGCCLLRGNAAKATARCTAHKHPELVPLTHARAQWPSSMPSGNQRQGMPASAPLRSQQAPRPPLATRTAERPMQMATCMLDTTGQNYYKSTTEWIRGAGIKEQAATWCDKSNRLPILGICRCSLALRCGG